MSNFDTSRKELVQSLIDEGLSCLHASRQKIEFETNIEEAEILLNNIEEYPHVFVLACVMDRQFITGKTWAIPYHVGSHAEVGGFDFDKFLKLDLPFIQKIFYGPPRLLRFWKKMAGEFYLAVQDINEKYSGNATLIWEGKPRSAAVVRNFLEFKGVGIKIATMATNILARDFKIPMADLASIDISPDVRVKRYFIENRLLRAGAKNEELVYLARELYPDYPGVFDLPAWKRDRVANTKSKKRNEIL